MYIYIYIYTYTHRYIAGGFVSASRPDGGLGKGSLEAERQQATTDGFFVTFKFMFLTICCF